MYIYYDNFSKPREAVSKGFDNLPGVIKEYEYFKEDDPILFVFLNEILKNLNEVETNTSGILLFSNKNFNKYIINNEESIHNGPVISIRILDFVLKFIEYVYSIKDEYTLEDITTFLFERLKIIERLEIADEYKDKLEGNINHILTSVTFYMLDDNLYDYIDASLSLDKTLGG